MLFGLDVSNYGEYADPRTLAGLAREAEESGWDGFFIFDHILPTDFGAPLFDPWITLAAIAMNTERLRIGPMVTPVPRRRPRKLARETVSLDHLSNGRLILGVGLGGPPDREFETFDESGDARVRAGLLNEGVDVLAGMWTGEPFAYEGEHYRVKEQVFLPTPVQSPRIPVWVSAKWRNRAPLRRAARWDGVFPIPHDGEHVTPEDLRSVVRYVTDVSGHRGRLRRRAGGPGRRSKLRPYRGLCQGGTDLVDPAYSRALDRLAGRDQSGNSARTSGDLALSSGPDRLRLTGACRRYGRGGPGEYGPGPCE